jgi:hypothetical protein
MIASQLFQRRNILVMLLLTIVTLGIYPLVWFYQTKRQLDPLDTYTRLTWHPLVLAAGLLAANIFSVTVVRIPKDLAVLRPISHARLDFDRLLAVALTFVIIYLALVVRCILEEYSEKYLDEEVKFSKFATFVLNIFYLQYKMNRLAAAKKNLTTEDKDEG